VSKIYFWEKTATKPEEESKDACAFYELDEDPKIREVIRELEGKIIGNKRTLSEINPNNPSVKKWVRSLLTSYPEKNNGLVEDLLNEFRAVLHTRSKEKERFIVGVLQLNDCLVIVHCKKNPSLAEIEDKLYSVRTVLHPKNVIRADVVKNEDGKVTLSAFEYSKRLSNGHAEFWGIEPEDVGWESLGSIKLNIELARFPIPIQLPIETEQLQGMIKDKIISPSGNIKIGKEEGKITKVYVYGKVMSYSEFYDFLVTQTEKLESYKTKFDEIVTDQTEIAKVVDGKKYHYEEDSDGLFEITVKGNNRICKKEHPRFEICFFTDRYPGIKPAEKFLWKFYQSIFENMPLEIWHSGEKSSDEPIEIGKLSIYNQIEFPEQLQKFQNQLLNQIQDCQSKKTKKILEYCFCKLYQVNLKNKHFRSLFEFLVNSIIIRELDFEFTKNEGLLQKEDLLEFKSADDVKGNPTEFVKTKLIPTIKKYCGKNELKRCCILYGVEDGTTIKPLYHLKNDQITNMENLVHKELSKENFSVYLQPIPFKEGIILAVYIIPKVAPEDKNAN